MPRCDGGTGSSGAPCAETKRQSGGGNFLVRSSSATSSATTLPKLWPKSAYGAPSSGPRASTTSAMSAEGVACAGSDARAPRPGGW